VSGTTRPGDVLVVSVHGPAGVLDLQVPARAASVDVATEYARQAGLDAVPVLLTRLGGALPADGTLAEAGVATGAVLVAHAPDPHPVRGPRRVVRAEPSGRLATGPISALWCGTAAVAAVVGAYAASRMPESAEPRLAAVVLLVAAAVLGVVPVGPLARHRAVAAPACAGAAALVVVWDPAPDRLPVVVGVASLVAGATAGVAWLVGHWLVGRTGVEALRVWVVAGGGVAATCALAELADLHPQVVWAVLLLAGALVARFVPALAVDVPDQHLVDLDRLAVTAASARDRAPHDPRPDVPRQGVVDVVTRGAATVTAASAAVLVVVPVAAVLLVRAMTHDVDLVGARVEVGLAGAVLLLASRNHRHVAARRMLRLAGLVCWAVLAQVLLTSGDERWPAALASVAVLAGVVMVAVAVAVGRGWRSLWWSRATDLLEAAVGALLIGSVVVAAGVVQALWTVAG
jgi:hypothetical protein